MQLISCKIFMVQKMERYYFRFSPDWRYGCGTTFINSLYIIQKDWITCIHSLKFSLIVDDQSLSHSSIISVLRILNNYDELRASWCTNSPQEIISKRENRDQTSLTDWSIRRFTADCIPPLRRSSKIAPSRMILIALGTALKMDRQQK